MKRISSVSSLLVLGLWGGMNLVGCARPAEPPPGPPVAPLPPPATTAAPAPALAREPTEEEKKKAAQLQALEQDKAEFRAEQQAELTRFTPELKQQARVLADTAYTSVRTALRAVLKSPHRKPGNPERDKYRHPQETLEFFGLKLTQTVLEYGPGEGWYTEVLAPVLAKQGKLIVTSPDPNGPPDQAATFYGERTKLFLERSPELYGKVERVIIDPKAPNLTAEGTVDLVLVNRALHGMYNNKTIDAWLAEFHGALKPNGVLGIEQHRAAPGKSPDETSKQGYLAEAWVIEKVSSAGFKLLGKSEINANPKDTKDHPEGVWTLPPTLRLGQKDRDKYVAIGETDRMTLKFAKVAKPAAPAAAAAPAGKAVPPASPPAKAATPATPAAATPGAPAAAAPATPGAATPTAPGKSPAR
jgi:predicted methyltransferase